MSRLARFSNNATSRLAANLSAVGTTVSITPGDGSKFPSLSAGQYFMATLIRADGTKEIVKTTNRSTDTLTIVRAAEPVSGVQTAFSFSAGDKIELRLTAGGLSNELDRLDLAALTRATTKSVNYTVVEGDISTLIRVDTSGGSRTITLPLISTLTDAFEIVVTKITADTNLVNVTPSGSDTINGGSSYGLSSSYQSAWVIADRVTNTWTAINSGLGGATPVIDTFVGAGSAGPFTLSGDPVSKNNTAVYVGGVYQQKSSYTLVGTAMTLGGTVAVGVPVEVAWIRPVALGSTTDDLVVTAPAPGGLWASVRGFITWMYARYSELIGQFGSSLIGFTQAGTGAVARTVQDKLYDVVDAADFILTPGVSDSVDQAGVQLAINKAAILGGRVRIRKPIRNVWNLSILTVPANVVIDDERNIDIGHTAVYGTGGDVEQRVHGTSVTGGEGPSFVAVNNATSGDRTVSLVARYGNGIGTSVNCYLHMGWWDGSAWHKGFDFITEHADGFRSNLRTNGGAAIVNPSGTGKSLDPDAAYVAGYYFVVNRAANLGGGYAMGVKYGAIEVAGELQLNSANPAVRLRDASGTNRYSLIGDFPSAGQITLYDHLAATAMLTFTSAGVCTLGSTGITFGTSVAAAAVPNNTLFRDSADNKLKFRDNSGSVNLLY